MHGHMFRSSFEGGAPRNRFRSASRHHKRKPLGKSLVKSSPGKVRSQSHTCIDRSPGDETCAARIGNRRPLGVGVSTVRQSGEGHGGFIILGICFIVNSSRRVRNYFTLLCQLLSVAPSALGHLVQPRHGSLQDAADLAFLCAERIAGEDVLDAACHIRRGQQVAEFPSAGAAGRITAHLDGGGAPGRLAMLALRLHLVHDPAGAHLRPLLLGHLRPVLDPDVLHRAAGASAHVRGRAGRGRAAHHGTLASCLVHRGTGGGVEAEEGLAALVSRPGAGAEQASALRALRRAAHRAVHMLVPERAARELVQGAGRGGGGRGGAEGRGVGVHQGRHIVQAAREGVGEARALGRAQELQQISLGANDRQEALEALQIRATAAIDVCADQNVRDRDATRDNFEQVDDALRGRARREREREQAPETHHLEAMRGGRSWKRPFQTAC
eukprot:scaffold5102_cov267-Pinguiococcus_pyrenoidosus.AAC.1